MKLQQEGKWEEAKTLYRDILESEVMEGGAATEAPPSSTILRLKFLVYKNIASVAKQQGDYSAAADAYIEVNIPPSPQAVFTNTTPTSHSPSGHWSRPE